jgi:molybdopterin/thiamine biosynthesis adenylyltransferase
MAAPGGIRMGACETSPTTHARPGTPSPATDPTPTAASSQPMIRRRSSASSSFVLGSAASGSASGCSNWTPPNATAQPGSYEKFHGRTVSPTPRRPADVTGTGTHAPLTHPAPMGAIFRHGCQLRHACATETSSPSSGRRQRGRPARGELLGALRGHGSALNTGHAATGIEHVAVMDFDSLEIINLDRLPGATALDVALHRGKAEHGLRQLHRAATAAAPDLHGYEDSVCEEQGQSVALDYDVIFSCVDRPWPRAVLNQLAYSDLIPVIDGGIAIDAFDDGDGMRNATWRSHVLRPGRPCLECNRQLKPAEVTLDRQGLLDDHDYIRSSGRKEPARQNVATLSISAAASQLAQFISLAVAPGGIGEPGPLQYVLSTHELERPPALNGAGCHFEQFTGRGNTRAILTGTHERAERARAARRDQQQRPIVRLARTGDDLLLAARRKLASLPGLRVT